MSVEASAGRSYVLRGFATASEISGVARIDKKGEVTVYTSRKGAVKGSTIRLSILVVILVAAAILLVIDRSARSAADHAYQQIASQLPSDDETDASKLAVEIDQQAVREITGKEPTSTETQGDTIVEKFVWKGIRGTYSIEASYRRGVKPFLVNVQKN
jgi:hypothetical protein